ncbi:hypothetical protein INS49_006705 [Diaporthe citri]|uniref:uncharacterized protein n=1 Tax=Diaporthe citri TaxID=83186 RepID=UPI001C80D2FF|nr:uncharacterized protein INS49_006705 [Diaporthe citri]KAG6365098.1 hypothetical protein INS49_006705 [Diaporthe citri]
MVLHSDRPVDLYNRVEELTTILSMETVTPLLRHEIECAISLHLSALQHSRPSIDDQQFEELTETYKGVVGHWTRTYQHLANRANLLRNIDMFQRLLALKLLEDYAGEPFEITGDLLNWTREQWAIITKQGDYAEESHRVVKDDHKSFITTPCEEIMVDYHLVEPKVCSAAEGQHPGGDVQHFIRQRDWLSLASALFNDRKLASDLFTDKRPVGKYSWGEKIPADILRRIEELQKKYFEVLSNPASFTLTKYAEGLSAKDTSSPPGQTSSFPLKKHQPQSWTVLAKGIYHTIAGGRRSDVADTEVTTE